MKQSSTVAIVLLLLLIPVYFMWNSSLTQTRPTVCKDTKRLSFDSSSNTNGNIGTSKCCDAIRGVNLEQVCSYDGKAPKPTKYTPPECSCMDYFYCKLVVVSSISSNHLNEATEMIVSVQKHMPNTKLIMYSLGLTNGEMALLRSYCNVEVRVFDFDKYPNISYAKNHLRTFVWKPIVVKEVSEQYEVVMYFDSSIRLNGPITDKILKYLQSSPGFISGPWWGNKCLNSNMPIVSFTHDETLKYLFPKKSNNITALRKELSVWGHLQAGCWIMWINSEMKRKLLDNWVDCALHEQCMAPKKADIDGCLILTKIIFTGYAADGTYTGCHRYDQSALNIILYREFGPGSTENICHELVFNLLVIKRQNVQVFLVYAQVGFTLTLIVIIFFLNWCCC